MRGCWSREDPGEAAGRTGAGRTGGRGAITGAVEEAEAEGVTGETERTGGATIAAVRREEVIFVAVVRAEETMETDKCHSELPKLTARPGTSQSLMKDFAVKTKNFYK